MSGRGPPARTVSVEELGRYMRALPVAAGCDEENPDLAAEGFLAADLRGVGLQGLDHMPTLLDALRDGRTRPRVVGDSAGAVLIDGGRGPGQAAAMLAVECAIERARGSGSCANALNFAGRSWQRFRAMISGTQRAGRHSGVFDRDTHDGHR